MIEYFDVRPGGDIHNDADVTRYVAELGDLEVAPDHSGEIELHYTIPAQ
jgi:hypothetical protein